jgi:hypothetical protein
MISSRSDNKLLTVYIFEFIKFPDFLESVEMFHLLEYTNSTKKDLVEIEENQCKILNQIRNLSGFEKTQKITVGAKKTAREFTPGTLYLN